MKKVENKLIYIVFIISLFILISTIVEFWMLWIYVDEHNTDPATVLWGEVFLTIHWLKLLASLISSLFLFLIIRELNES